MVRRGRGERFGQLELPEDPSAIPDVLPARRIGNRWYVNRAVAEKWANESDPASVMAHPDTRRVIEGQAAAAVAR